jgi:hypothetical protein
MKKRLVITAIAILSAIILSCGNEKPTDPEGSNSVRLYAIDTSGVQGGWVALEGATIKVSSSTHQFAAEYETGPGGYAVLDQLVAGTYTLQAELINEEERYTILGQKEISVVYDPQLSDSILMDYQQSSPLTINEIYYCGCNYSRFYFYDQFVELYNSSPDTIWLDGYLMCRNTQIAEVIDPEEEDYALAYYVFKFPGETGVTRTSPIAPGQHLVIAGDATDHSIYGGGWCIDLSSSDWEFFNPLGSDYDVPDVPNLTPISNLANDFTMNLAHCAIYIATGEEWEYGMHFDGYDMKEYIHIPLWTIVDGVEYASNTDATRYMTLRIDAGLAGIGMGKYSATSVQRRFPGLDSNNSTFDFENIRPPSPGWQ